MNQLAPAQSVFSAATRKANCAGAKWLAKAYCAGANWRIVHAVVHLMLANVVLVAVGLLVLVLVVVVTPVRGVIVLLLLLLLGGP